MDKQQDYHIDMVVAHISKAEAMALNELIVAWAEGRGTQAGGSITPEPDEDDSKPKLIVDWDVNDPNDTRNIELWIDAQYWMSNDPATHRDNAYWINMVTHNHTFWIAIMDDDDFIHLVEDTHIVVDCECHPELETIAHQKYNEPDWAEQRTRALAGPTYGWCMFGL